MVAIPRLPMRAGGDNPASVRALEHAELSRFSRRNLERVLPRDEAGSARLQQTLPPRLWRSQLASHLATLLDCPDAALLLELEEHAEPVMLGAGETLFRRGDRGEVAYVVISGRLRVVDDTAGERVLNEVGAGEMLGEIALLSGEARSATAYAMRDSLLAKLPAGAFDRLIHREPRVLQQITGLLVERLRNDGRAGPRASSMKTLAVVPACGRREFARFVRRLFEALAVHGVTAHIDPPRVDRALEFDGIAYSENHDPANLRLVQWLNEQELMHDFVLYEAEASVSAWTERAVRQADHVLFVADASAAPEPTELERCLGSRWRRMHAPRRSLVLLWPVGATLHGTAAFLEGRDVDCHYHVRVDVPEDLARLARCLAGVGIGLVLGGGGARGFAHLGVLRALAEANVAIDCVGGTSIGAIIAAAAAQGLAPEQALAGCKEHFRSLRDPTLPLVSLLAGRQIGARLDHAFGSLAIEDLPVPFFCVSTNLSRATQTIHRRGSLMRSIRASISIPGILPPTRIDTDLHVDGGLINNLPIDVMSATPEIGAVIAVDVSADEEMVAPPDLEPALSGWRVLWQRFNPWARKTPMPSIMGLLTRSAMVASVYWARERHTARAASLYLHVPVADLRPLAFKRIDEIAARGYDSTRVAIHSWWSAFKAKGACPQGPWSTACREKQVRVS